MMGKRGKRGRRGNGEGTIYERTNGTYAATFTVEGGKRKTFYAKTHKEVQEKLKKALYEQQQGTLVTAPHQTVAQFLTDWLESTQKQSVRPRTYERYEEIVRLHIIPALGRHKLQSLSAQHVQAFYTKKLEGGLSALTVISFHNLLHKALETAVKLRRGELLGLKWQDIDFAKGALQVRRVLSRIPSIMPGKGYTEAEPKTQRSRRTIIIAPFALKALKEHRMRQAEEKKRAGEGWQEHDYVFCTPIGTRLNPTRDMLDQLKVFLKKAGLPDIRFHDLRHSSATLLLSLGVHPKVVQEILGHSQISMTLDIYSHVLPSMHQDAMNRLNQAIEEEESEDDELEVGQGVARQ